MEKYNINIGFYRKRFSTGSSKSMGCFRIQLLLKDITWSSRYNIAENDRSSNSTPERALVSLSFYYKKLWNKTNL